MKNEIQNKKLKNKTNESLIYKDLYELILKKLKKNKKNSKNVLTSWKKSCILSHVERTWSLSSAGRASALQAGGHRFEPCSDHHVFTAR